MISKQLILARRPTGNISEDTFELVDAPLKDLGKEEVLVEVDYISIDPAMRGWINEGKSYIAPVQIGEVMRAWGVGRVIESTSEEVSVDDYIVGFTGVQNYAVLSAKGLQKVDPHLAPLERYLGVLGVPGMTAYFGLLDTGAPKQGDTVVVSGAAGAVGSVVGQIAKIKQCRVVGIAGGKEKCNYLVEELGFDSAIDYKNSDVRKELKKTCPNGVDIYFDNVGGDILDVVLGQIALNARIVICGAISQYNNTTPVKGPSNYLSLLVNRARMEGIVVTDNAARYGEAAADMVEWIDQGRLLVREHIVQGLETFPTTLQMLFNGENFGKLVIKVTEN